METRRAKSAGREISRKLAIAAVHRYDCDALKRQIVCGMQPQVDLNALKPMFALIGLLCISIIIYQVVGRYVLRYKFEEKYFAVLLFDILPILSVAYTDIVEARRVSGFDLWMPNFSAIRCGNKLFGDAVAIQLKRKIANVIFVTPDNTKKFLEEMEKRVGTANYAELPKT